MFGPILGAALRESVAQARAHVILLLWPLRESEKADVQLGLEMQPWYPVIKQESDRASPSQSFIHPSYYLYMCDKVVAPNVSLTSAVPQRKEAPKAEGKITEVKKSLPEQVEKAQNGGKHQKAVSYPELSLEEQERIDLKTSREVYNRKDAPVPTDSTGRKNTEPGANGKSNETNKAEMGRETRASPPACVKDISCEDDKGRIMEAVMNTYIKQQEKLNSILQKKQQLQMEVEMLSSSKAMKELTEEQQNLQKELECLQTEHAQRMEEFYIEQRDLEKRLEQVMKQKCTCDSNLEKDKEAEYAAQLAELRQRLDHAEADRQELQDELRQEREARQKLEMMIKELKLQILKSSKTAKE
uniref:SKI like proto-onco n=1 Tax=Ornithorhynchus anatinus TaxID=9258 RepID=A0A6I8NVQ0_ORNAN